MHLHVLRIFFIHLSAHGCLRGLCFLAVLTSCNKSGSADYLFDILILFLLDIYPGGRLLDLRVVLLILRESLHAFCSSCTNLYSHQQCTWAPFPRHVGQYLLSYVFWIIAHVTGVRWYCGFDLYFHWLLMWAFFISFWSFVCFLLRDGIKVCCSFFVGFFFSIEFFVMANSTLPFYWENG